MRAEELTRSAALADCQRQLQALVQQVAAERAAVALREQQTLHDLRASLTQSSKLAADVDVELLAAELKAAEHDVAVEQRQGVRRMELLVAANKIREKWRGRSRRAKDELAFKKATLELASDWSSHFEDLLRSRVPPVLKFDAINIHAGLAWRKVSWAPGRWLCVHYAVPHDTHTPYIYILSLCAQGLYKMCIDSFTEPLLDRFSSPQKHQHRAKT